MTIRRRGETREQRGLARPEAGCADAFEADQREGLPGLPDQREHHERGRLEGQPEQERVAPADAVDGGACHQPRGQCGHAAEGKREARLGERDPAHVVEVDDDERQDDPVPERVDDAADLNQPDLARQMRVELAEVRGQRAHLRRRLRCRHQDARALPVRPSEMTGRSN